MAPTTPTGPPSTITAGDSVRFRIADHADYPQSEGWDLQYDLQGASRLLDTTDISVGWQASGDDAQHWLVTITAAKTEALTPGRYRLVGRFAGSGTYAGRRETLAVLNTVVVVEPNAATATAGDFQTHAEKTLAVIEAALEGRLASDLESYQIAGRAVNKIPVRELQRLRGRYAGLVRQERTGSLVRSHHVRFPSHA